MRSYYPAAAASAAGLLFIVQYFSPALGGLGGYFIDCGIIIAGFAIIAGIVNLIMKNVRIIYERQPGWLYGAVVILSFTATVCVGLLNLGERHFMKKYFMEETPVYMTAAADSVIEADPYFSHYPAKEKLKLIMYRRMDEKYFPEQAQFDRAKIAAQTYFSVFNARGGYDRKTLSGIFNDDDIAALSRLEDNIRVVSGRSLDQLIPFSRDIGSWMDKALETVPDDPVTEAAVSVMVFPDLVLGGTVVKGSGAEFGRALAGLMKKEGLTVATVLHLKKSRIALLESSSLPLLAAQAVTESMEESLTKDGKIKVAKAFFITGATGYPSIKAGLRWIFNTIYSPLNSTVYALLAFFMITAAYRAFRVKTRNAFIMLVSACAVIIGQIPFSNWVAQKFFGRGELFSDAADWLMTVPGMAAQRAILIGIALGVVYLSLRILTGRERGYTGED